MKKLFALFAFSVFLFANRVCADVTEQPPFETPDPAVSGNFREVFYGLDKLSLYMTASPDSTTGFWCIDSPTLCVDTVNHRVGIGISNPSYKLHVQDNTNALVRGYVSNTNTTSSQERRAVVGALGNNSNSEISMIAGLDSSGNDFQFIGGNSKTQIGVGGVPYWNMTSAGIITQSSQPCFLAYPSADQTNATGNTNVDVTVVFNTELFDVGNNFASNTFTAPVTGKYYLYASVHVSGLTAAMTSHIWKIKTTGRTYRNVAAILPLATGSVGGAYTYLISCLADMASGDTATVTLDVFDGAGNTVTITSSSASVLDTYFGGTLVN